jgi:peptidoglycan/LPS O-acetylase OafA/YrhL
VGSLNIARIARRLVPGAAFVGVFSYSLYLTHELVIMQSWWFITWRLPPVLNTLLIVVPATVLFAWVFYLFCEKPYMRKTKSGPQVSEVRGRASEVGGQRSEVGSPTPEIIEGSLVYTPSDI